MSPQNPDASVLQTLSRRAPVLSTLEDGPRGKHDLLEELTVSRSTVDRAIRELESAEFVERCDGVYRLTVAGRLVLTEYRQRVATLGSIANFSDLLRCIPRNAPMSVQFLTGATVHEPKPHTPNAPFEVIATRLDDAEVLRGSMVAERVPRFRSRLCERTVDDDLEATVVLTDELADYFFERCSDELRDAMAHGSLELLATPTIPYGLWIVDTPSNSDVFVVVYGDSADVRGVIQNDSSAALEWANGVYDSLRERARDLDGTR